MQRIMASANESRSRSKIRNSSVFDLTQQSYALETATVKKSPCQLAARFQEKETVQRVTVLLQFCCSPRIAFLLLVVGVPLCP